jgi:uncharacterized damage-inducible protein DinB
MNEVQRITDQMRRAFDGSAWHGPAVSELLNEIDSERAAAHVLPDRHSIWELVLHMAAWKDVVARRLAGEQILELPPEKNFPPVVHADAEAWLLAKNELRNAHNRLLDAAARITDDRLDMKLAKGTTAYELLHGIIQHDLYHAGQIALLRR